MSQQWHALLVITGQDLCSCKGAEADPSGYRSSGVLPSIPLESHCGVSAHKYQDHSEANKTYQSIYTLHLIFFRQQSQRQSLVPSPADFYILLSELFSVSSQRCIHLDAISAYIIPVNSYPQSYSLAGPSWHETT